jgi:ABC-type antimicrobial peptide transport system permease subunit
MARGRLGLALTSAGVIVGTAAATALTRLLEKLLFQVSPSDPAAFVGVAALVVVLTLAACYLTARKATRIQPIEALRFE